MKSHIFASALLLATVSGAHAADVVMQEGATAYNWSGIYVGAQVGYVAGGRVHHDYIPSDTYDYRMSPRGAFGGIFGGYNYQIDSGIVVGVEGDINWGNIKATGETVGDQDFASTTKLDWNGSGRARLGYAIDRFMPYLTTGFAVAHFKFNERQLGSFYSEASKSLTGWTAGAGVEYALTDNWMLRGEYRYTQYGKKDFVAMPMDEDWETKFRTHDVRLGVAYKF